MRRAVLEETSLAVRLLALLCLVDHFEPAETRPRAEAVGVRGHPSYDAPLPSLRSLIAMPFANETLPPDPVPPPDEGPAQLTPAAALDMALHLHRTGELGVAEVIYTRILETVPDHPGAMHFLGLLNYQTGRSAEAFALLERAVGLDPDDAGLRNNLGNMLAEQGRLVDAAGAYQAAIALRPDHAEAHNNLGAACRALGHLEEAEASYRAAIRADPRHRNAHDNLGHLLLQAGRIDEAIDCHARALELEPQSADSRRGLVAAYGHIGAVDKALAVLGQWLGDEPDNPVARHLMAAISGQDVPARASDPYIESVFDRFSTQFDAKLKRLNYRAPDLVAAAARAACGAPAATLTVLDAGCGTGLCGPLLRPFAAHLTGVDLSAGMLTKAQGRGGYDALAKAELTAFMLAEPDRFDLVVSADTLCYFGALGPVLAAAAGSLRAGGHLVFTVEREASDAPFRLNQHGRYSHRADHVLGALAAAGLEGADLHEDVLRREGGADVKGLVVTARKSSLTRPGA